MKFNAKSLLKDRRVLYVVLALAVMNLFGYIMLKDLDAVLFFLAIGLVTSYFSKNMIVIMLISLVITNFVMATRQDIREGMEEGKVTNAEKAVNDAKKVVNDAKKAVNDAKNSEQKNEANTALADANKALADANKALADANAKAKKGKAKGKKSNSDNNEATNADNEATNANKEVTNANKEVTNVDNEEKTEQFVPASEFEESEVLGTETELDTASTLETAYRNLSGLLNSPAMQNMSEQTNRLAKHQSELINGINKMSPLMADAQKLMKDFDLDKITGLVGNMNNALINTQQQ